MSNKTISNILLNLILLAALLIGPYFLLRPIAPKYIDYHMNRITILDQDGTPLYRIGSKDFACTSEGEIVMSCQTTIEGKVLIIGRTSAVKYDSGCQASYNNTAVPCRASWGWGELQVDDDLGISDARYTQLRRQTPFVNWMERDWIRAAAIATAAVTLLSLGWFWHQAHQLKWFSTSGRRLFYTLGNTAITGMLFTVTSILTLFNLYLID